MKTGYCGERAEDSSVYYSCPYFFSKKEYLVEVKISAHIFFKISQFGDQLNDKVGGKHNKKYADNSFSAETVLDQLSNLSVRKLPWLAICGFQSEKQVEGRDLLILITQS